MNKIVVDIDGTILYSELIDETYIVNGYNIPLIRKLNKLWRQGNKVILHTGRHWNHLDLTKRQLEKANVLYDSLIMGKPPADYYIDDKGISPGDFMKVSI
jgi:uncharacterized HAD superfamily protein